MRALLQKEWLLFKPLLWRVLVMGLPVFFIFYFAFDRGSDEVVFGMVYGFNFMFIFAYIFQVSFQEEKVGAMRFLRSLPISCYKIVGVKFLVLYLFAAVSLLFGFVLAYILQIINVLPQLTVLDFLSEGLSSLASVLLVGNLMLWANIRFGRDKMAWVLLILFFLFLGGIGSLVAAVKFFDVSMAANYFNLDWLIHLLVFFGVVPFCFWDSVQALRKKDLG
ncbi:MAG: ABC-2 transporter permease [Thermoanaerobacteraceae bacterium]|nr:ABC-2 transporter permease [Thermoanaerobacteraceae bacterium]